MFSQKKKFRTFYSTILRLIDESELLDKMPLVMRTAIAVDINLATFQKIDLFKVPIQNLFKFTKRVAAHT